MAMETVRRRAGRVDVTIRDVPRSPCGGPSPIFPLAQSKKYDVSRLIVTAGCRDLAATTLALTASITSSRRHANQGRIARPQPLR